MTEEEVKKIPFRMVSHISMADESVCTYIDKSERLGFCIHTPVLADYDGMKEYGKPRRHYRIDAKIYKSYKKWIEALKDLDCSQFADLK